MLINVKDLQNICKTILVAVDKADNKAANLELVAENNMLELNVTNTEYYVSVKVVCVCTESFRAVVKAQKFLSLVADLTVEDITIEAEAASITITAGKSHYTLPLIFENDKLVELPIITLSNKTIEMPISLDVLSSIVNINSKELTKIENKDKATLSEWQRGYYITEEGCLTFTTGACLNGFKLEKPIKMLLNERIVKLFKLFNSDVAFSFGYDALANGTVQNKVVFETENIYLAAIITNDDVILSKLLGPYSATKDYINANYSNKVVVSTTSLNKAITRLVNFSKTEQEYKNFSKGTFTLEPSTDTSTATLIITDKDKNVEAVNIENTSIIDPSYKMKLNLNDLKLVLDVCKEDFVTLNFGNHQSVVVSRGTICNLIPELEV